MGQVTMVLPPPKLWQQFEELTCDVAKFVFDAKSASNYGNQGAAQDGVDVYCIDSSGRLIGIQCKRLGRLDVNGNRLAGGLKLKHVEEEVKKAENYMPSLQHYIIATTDARQTELQKAVLAISENRRQSGIFTCEVWFWDDYLSYLHKNLQLLEWFYQNVLQLKGVYNFEHQILYLLHMAFSRPAFSTPIRAEGGGTELITAIKDTQAALNTGQLRDRETRGLLRAAPGGIGLLENPQWKDELNKVLSSVKDVRTVYENARKQGSLIENQYHIDVNDPNVEQQINALRGEAILTLNRVLKNAGITEVESDLI